MGAVACLCLVAAGCSRGTADPGSGHTVAADPDAGPERVTREIGDRGTFYLRVADQPTDGRTVVVDEALFTGTSGWVVIHTHVRGGYGPIIGRSELLPPGTSRNVTVTFDDRPAGPWATVYPMLHVESTANTAFDYPDGDPEASSADGNVVVLPMRIEVG